MVNFDVVNCKYKYKYARKAKYHDVYVSKASVKYDAW